MMNYAEEQQWLASLKEGDEVVVRSYGNDCLDTIQKITPTRQFLLSHNKRFNSNGRKTTKEKWGGAWLAPVTDEVRAQLTREKIVSEVWSEICKLNINDVRKLSDERLKEILAVLKQAPEQSALPE